MSVDEYARRAHEAYYRSFGIQVDEQLWRTTAESQPDHAEAWRAVADAIGPRHSSQRCPWAKAGKECALASGHAGECDYRPASSTNEKEARRAAIAECVAALTALDITDEQGGLSTLDQAIETLEALDHE